MSNKQKIGTEKFWKSKINYNEVIRQILQFAPKSVWRHQWRHRSTEKVWDNIFLKTIVFKVTKILDPKHHNPI